MFGADAGDLTAAEARQRLEAARGGRYPYCAFELCGMRCLHRGRCRAGLPLTNWAIPRVRRIMRKEKQMQAKEPMATGILPADLRRMPLKTPANEQASLKVRRGSKPRRTANAPRHALGGRWLAMKLAAWRAAEKPALEGG